MNTYEKIKAARIDAMKNRQSFRKDTLSSILAALKQVEVDTRKQLTQTDVDQILTKLAKQRTESYNQYMAAQRLDLAEIEHTERTIIEEFLPEQLSAMEVSVMINDAITTVQVLNGGTISSKDMGKVIGILRPQLTGRYDMGKASASVKALLG